MIDSNTPANCALTLLSDDAFRVPAHDPQFMRLSEAARELVAQRLQAMQRIAAARNKSAEITAVARPGERGWGRGTVVNTWYRFAREKQWTALLDKAQAGPMYWGAVGVIGLPLAFREHIGEQWHYRQRGKFRRVFADLKDQYHRWRAGDKKKKIPGYAECPPATRTGLPEGWTYSNLFRVAKDEATIYGRKLIAQGPKAASRYTPKIITTRAGIEVGQVLFPDDCWNDFYCRYKANRSRILTLHLLDLASARNVLRGHKPTHEDERGVEERLREAEMVWLLAAYFTRYGYHPAGTVIACEKSTATVRPEEEAALDGLTAGKIVVDRSPAGGGPGVAGLFADRSGGNPNFKAPIESFFNLLHNACDHMLEFPGQLGSNSRLNCPEGTAAMAARDEAMEKCKVLFTPALRDRIRMNLLHFTEAAPMLDTKIDWLNSRHDHELMNWRECGNIVDAFRPSYDTPWLPAEMIEQLSPEQKMRLEIVMQSDPHLQGEIKLSPNNVWDRGVKKLTRFTPAQTAQFLSKLPPVERPVEQGMIELGMPEVDPDKAVLYGPILRNGDGMEEALPSDGKFAVRGNPIAPETAWVYGPRGEWIGFLHRYDAPRRTDYAAVTEAVKRKHKVVSQWTGEVRQQAKQIAERQLAIESNNAQVIHEAANQQEQLKESARAGLFAGNE